MLQQRQQQQRGEAQQHLSRRAGRRAAPRRAAPHRASPDPPVRRSAPCRPPSSRMPQRTPCTHRHFAAEGLSMGGSKPGVHGACPRAKVSDVGAALPAPIQVPPQAGNVLTQLGELLMLDGLLQQG